jgi:hypothetical protein
MVRHNSVATIVAAIFFLVWFIPSGSVYSAVVLVDPDGKYVSPIRARPYDPQAQALQLHEEAIGSGRERLGCIDRPAVQCLAGYGTKATISLPPVWENGRTLLGDGKIDSSGMPQRVEKIFATSNININSNLAIYLLQLNTDQSNEHYVNSVELDLPSLYFIYWKIESPEELSKYYVYDFTYPIIAGSCPNIQENEVNEFIYNIMRGFVNRKGDREICGVYVYFRSEGGREYFVFSGG